MLRAIPSLLALLPLALFSSAAAQDADPAAEHGLTLSLDILGELQIGTKGRAEYLQRVWTGEVEGAGLTVELFIIPRADHDLNEPGEVVALTEVSLANADRRAKRPPFAFDETRPLTGHYGFVSYAWLGFDTRHDGTKPVGHFWCLGGILPEDAYTIEITASSALNEAGLKRVERFLAEGVRYEGPVADPEWTDEEILERWKRQAPDRVLEKSKLTVVRSKHYLIMTNVGRGTAKGFAKKIDECYEAIRSVYPFDDVDGQRLLPIFYFVTSEQYFEWCVKNLGWEMAAARRSGGVSSGDVYATYHQATNAPVHIHEATHQVFGNRLHLPGGGSWFQEGVAEYMSSAPNELGLVKNLAKRKKHVALGKFFTIQSMLYSADPNRKTGGSAAGDNYTQAAALIEFVRHGKYKAKFQDFVHAIGRVPRNDLNQIEKELRRLFDRDVDGFDQDFVDYWKKRKKPKKR